VIEIREAADSNRVVIAPGQQRRTRRRAHGRGVEAGVAQSLRSQTIDRWRFDWRPVAAEIRKPHIVEQHDQDIGRSNWGPGPMWPPRRRLLHCRADLALKQSAWIVWHGAASSPDGHQVGRDDL